VAYDSTHGTNWVGPTVYGAAVGQTFLATDTLLESITVWRPYSPAFVHIFVVGTYNQIPQPWLLVGQGPDEGVPLYETPPPYESATWTFDPPLALPYAGLYAFFLQGYHCKLVPPFAVVVDSTAGYSDGQFWMTESLGPFDDCFMPPVTTFPHNLDMCFIATFCPTGPTRSRRTSWGELKLLYR
jgi:hypothetical protein